MNENILKISGLCKTYDGFELGPVDMTLPRGTITGFIGENGAGKTTTIKLVLGVVKKSAGSIELFGQPADSGRIAELKQRIGVIMSDKGFHDSMNAEKINSILSSIYVKWDSSRFFELLEKFSTPTKKAVKDLSRGMKMKLALATALSHDAELLILDEPTSGLDPIVRDELLDELMEFVSDESHSVLISSHITGDLEKIADYITFIHDGRIILSDEKDALLERCRLVKCSADDAAALPHDKVMGIRKNDFGAQVLMDREYAPRGAVIDRASLDDIMLFTIKGREQ